MNPPESHLSAGSCGPAPPHGDADEPVRLRFMGSLLASMCGDALGMPVEGRPPVEIMRLHGIVRDFLPARLGPGTYTDDTQMTMTLAESLVACRGFDGADLARRLLEGYEPHRGYGRGTREALTRLAAGIPWEQAGKSSFGVGSFGNGAATRVAPVGLLYHRELDLAAHVARASAEATHTHPLGRGGAAVQSLAVGLALRWGIHGRTPDPSRFLEAIEAHLEPNEGLFRERLETVGLLLERGEAPPLTADPETTLDWAEEVAAVLGHDSRSFQSVPTALYLFLSRPGDLESGLSAAVAVGGDTDTVAAMCGALFGAFLGMSALPDRWLTGLENGPRGRDYLAGLADDLFLFWLEEMACRPELDVSEGS